MNGIGFGRMEGECDHGLHFIQMDGDHAVIKSAFLRREHAEIFRPANGIIIVFHRIICDPDGTETAGLCGHDIDPDPEIHAQIPDAGTCKFQDPVLDETVRERLSYQGDGHIVRADAVGDFSVQPDKDDFWLFDIPGIVKELLGQFAAAFSDRHGTVTAIAGMGIGSQDHFSAACQFFPGKLMDDRLVGRHIDAAVSAGSGKSEGMVVFVDGAAYGAQAVMTVGKGIRDRKLRHAAGSGSLYDPDIGDIVRDHRVEPDPHQSVIFMLFFVGTQDLVGHGFFPGSRIFSGWDGKALFQFDTG